MPAELPKTPVGRHLGWVLDALRSAPSADEVKRHFSRTFLAQTPADTLVQILELRGGELRGFVLDRFEREAQREVIAILVTGGGAEYRLAVAVDDQRITRLLITHA
jgi:hypothetical protein